MQIFTKKSKILPNNFLKNNSSIRLVHYLRSKLLIPSTAKLTSKNETSKEKSKSVSCLIMENNGFITSDTGTGLLTILPLGKRVINKLTNLIREEMNKINGQEVDMPSLCDINLWSMTERDRLMGNELFRLNDRNGKKLCLCPTHEEVVTHLVSKYSKLLPSQCLGENNSLRIYQISKKFRDENRPKHGLLRAREFLMKDMYTFHTSEKCAKDTYDTVCKAYENIFDKLDLNYLKATAFVGAMGGTKSHEFHIESEIGEDKIFSCKNCGKSISIDLVNNFEKNLDIKDSIESKKLCEIICCKEKNDSNTESISYKKCIEIGHTFLLGNRYTKIFPVNLTHRLGFSENSNVIMGCYGIGVTRLMQACIEARNMDKIFPDWPLEICPFQIVILPSKEGSKVDEKSKKLVNYLCEMFEGNNLFKDEILVDDRTSMSIGSRIIDAKLIGIPYSIVLGKSIEEEQIEILINSPSIEKALGKNKLYCHSRETAHVLKQLNNDIAYMKKQKKIANYFKF